MKWIKLSDEKPKHSGCYYVAENNQVYTRHYSASEDLWHDGDLENLNNLHPTNWMPLPDPPAEIDSDFGAVVKRNWEGLNDDQKFIMGRPNFVCGGIAARLREMGFECNTKAEEEQALVIHTMLMFHEKCGTDWKDKLNEYLKNKH